MEERAFVWPYPPTKYGDLHDRMPYLNQQK
jgi:hypothetical protein